MSRSPAHADRTQPFDLESNEQTTKRLPTVTLFDLLAEARRIDAAVRAFDDERTVSMAPEENQRLIATALAAEERAPAASPPERDDEPTLDGPAPVVGFELALDFVPRQVGPAPEPPQRPTARPPALRSLVLTRPMPMAAAAVVAPSGVHPRITPERASEATTARRRSWLPEATTEVYVVAGIWATALSLIVFLLLLVSSAA
jgi:hypothetical protein